MYTNLLSFKHTYSDRGRRGRAREAMKVSLLITQRALELAPDNGRADCLLLPTYSTQCAPVILGRYLLTSPVSTSARTLLWHDLFVRFKVSFHVWAFFFRFSRLTSFFPTVFLRHFLQVVDERRIPKIRYVQCTVQLFVNICEQRVEGFKIWVEIYDFRGM